MANLLPETSPLDSGQGIDFRAGDSKASGRVGTLLLRPSSILHSVPNGIYEINPELLPRLLASENTSSSSSSLEFATYF